MQKITQLFLVALLFAFSETHAQEPKKPNAVEINACRPWLEAEIALVKPKVIVALGAVAAFGIPAARTVLAGRSVNLQPSGDLLTGAELTSVAVATED